MGNLGVGVGDVEEQRAQQAASDFENRMRSAQSMEQGANYGQRYQDAMKGRLGAAQIGAQSRVDVAGINANSRDYATDAKSVYDGARVDALNRGLDEKAANDQGNLAVKQFNAQTNLQRANDIADYNNHKLYYQGQGLDEKKAHDQALQDIAAEREGRETESGYSREVGMEKQRIAATPQGMSISDADLEALARQNVGNRGMHAPKSAVPVPAPAAAPGTTNSAPPTAPATQPAAQPTAATPPVSALKEGVNTTFKNGQTWTLKDGAPVRVSGP